MQLKMQKEERLAALRQSDEAVQECDAPFAPALNSASVEIIGSRSDTYITDVLARPKAVRQAPRPTVASPANYLRRRT